MRTSHFLSPDLKNENFLPLQHIKVAVWAVYIDLEALFTNCESLVELKLNFLSFRVFIFQKVNNCLRRTVAQIK